MKIFDDIFSAIKSVSNDSDAMIIFRTELRIIDEMYAAAKQPPVNTVIIYFEIHMLIIAEKSIMENITADK